MSEHSVLPLVATSVALVAGRDGKGKIGTEKEKPKEAVMAIEMLAAGKGYREIAAATGLGFEAIKGLRARHSVTLDERRKQLAVDGFELAEGIRLVAHRKLEMLAGDEEALAKTNIRDLMLSYGISQDKALGALGENKVVLEHRTKGVTLEDALAAISEARKRVEINVTPAKVGIDCAETGLTTNISDVEQTDEDDAVATPSNP